jgi:hypothetical protein
MGAAMTDSIGLGDEDVTRPGEPEQSERGADVERQIVDGAPEQVAAAEPRRPDAHDAHAADGFIAGETRLRVPIGLAGGENRHRLAGGGEFKRKV